MSKSCQGLLKDLVHCLRESECFTVRNYSNNAPIPLVIFCIKCFMVQWFYLVYAQIQKKDIKVCAREAEECANLRTAYAACKRGQLDPRARIRGNKGY